MTDNPWLVGAGVLLLIVDTVYTIAVLGPLVEKLGKNYTNKIDREMQEQGTVDTFKSMGKGISGFMFAVIGWTLEQEFALYEMGVE